MREVTQESFAAAQAGSAVVVDVREPGEYVAGHVPGAVLMPMGQLPTRLSEIPKGLPVYVICASGNRSYVHDELPDPGRVRRLLGGRWHVRLVPGRATAGDRSCRHRRCRVTHPRHHTPDLTPEPARGPFLMVTIVPIDTPTLGDRSYLAHDGQVALVVDPQRDIDRVLALAAGGGGADHARLRDPHPQRLRHRRAGAGAGDRRGVPRQRRRPGGLRAGPGARR